MTGHGVGASIGVVEGPDYNIIHGFICLFEPYAYTDPPIVAGVPTEGKLQADMIVTDGTHIYR